MRSTKVLRPTPQIDPLFIIFEQHLCNFSDPEMNRKEFILLVIRDYLSFLRKMQISIPRSLEESIIEELQSQVNVMLIKKIYGYLSIQDFQKNLSRAERDKVKHRYKKVIGA